MFKGIQDILHRNLAEKKPSTSDANTTFLSPSRKLIFSAAELLADPKRTTIINRLPQQFGLNEERFNTLVLPLVTQVIEFFQNLPETRNSYYAQEGGFIDHALERTSIALDLCRSYCLSEDSTEATSLTEPQLLWLYVIFSASLLQGIGRIVTDFNVYLYDQKGKPISSWQTLNGSMLLTQASYYEYEFTEDAFERSFRQRLTVLLARQLMPTEGLQWLATDLEALSIWLALLEEDMSGATGILGQILMQADAEAIKRYFEKLFLLKEFKDTKQQSAKYSALSTFKTNDVTTTTPSPEIGLEVLRWITEQIKSRELVIGQAPLLSVTGGVIMCKELFQLFISKHPEYKNAQVVEASVLSLLGKDARPTKANDPAAGVLLQKLSLITPKQPISDQRIAPNGKIVAAPAAAVQQAPVMHF